ncbi:hypothetical protein FTV88_2278 [Heliorestis convoluta]|uniref:Uncharacterized protein n=1 Tax=Heliorestis convoluta TaxID=356322 RepID=A0A5Q2N449_9FIRM|nr:hypothetical protein FTV88_2278 [Heliorestis convoluta]
MITLYNPSGSYLRYLLILSDRRGQKKKKAGSSPAYIIL